MRRKGGEAVYCIRFNSKYLKSSTLHFINEKVDSLLIVVPSHKLNSKIEIKDYRIESQTHFQLKSLQSKGEIESVSSLKLIKPKTGSWCSIDGQVTSKLGADFFT